MKLLTEILEAVVLASSQIRPDIYLLSLEAPTISRDARPGQFVHIRCSHMYDPLLRRPLSIHDIGSKGELVLLFQAKGRGTAWLAGQQAGNRINVLGPVGQGFSIVANKKVAIVAGGLGVVPLLFLARKLLESDNEVNFFLGAQDCDKLLRLEALRRMEVNLFLATDDGSAGFKGTVTDLWKKHLRPGAFDWAYACGPQAEMAEFARLAERVALPAEVSLEERMACGIGLCRGCVTAVCDASGHKKYENVCSCGPVFNAAAVCWED